MTPLRLGNQAPTSSSQLYCPPSWATPLTAGESVLISVRSTSLLSFILFYYLDRWLIPGPLFYLFKKILGLCCSLDPLFRIVGIHLVRASGWPHHFLLLLYPRPRFPHLQHPPDPGRISCWYRPGDLQMCIQHRLNPGRSCDWGGSGSL